MAQQRNCEKSNTLRRKEKEKKTHSTKKEKNEEWDTLCLYSTDVYDTDASKNKKIPKMRVSLKFIEH